MRISIKAFIFGLALLLSANAHGQGRQHHGVHGFQLSDELKSELKITEEQDARLKALNQKFRKEMKALRTEEFEDLMGKKAAMGELKAAQKAAIGEILTDEQKAILKENQQKKKLERKEIHKKRMEGIDREGLKKEMKTYREENILPVLRVQRNKLEEKINAGDKVTIAGLRSKFSEMHKRREGMKPGERGKHSRGIKPGEGQMHSRGKRAFNESEKEEIKTLHSLVDKYNDEIDALYGEIESSQNKWKEEMRKIAGKYIPKRKGGMERHRKGHFHKDKVEKMGKVMRKGHFLLLDPNEPAVPVERMGASADFSVYPNPAASANTLKFTVTNAGRFRIELRNKEGKLLKVLMDEVKQNGTYSMEVDLSSLQDGIYYYTISDAQGISSKKVVVSK